MHEHEFGSPAEQGSPSPVQTPDGFDEVVSAYRKMPQRVRDAAALLLVGFAGAEFTGGPELTPDELRAWSAGRLADHLMLRLAGRELEALCQVPDVHVAAALRLVLAVAGRGRADARG